MKTPIQKLIEVYQRMREEGDNDMRTVIYYAEDMLEEEREVIEEAYRDGCSECGIGEPPERTSEQYYDGHFNTTDKWGSNH
jgi:hypothetical protein